MEASSLRTGGNELLAMLSEATLDRMAPQCRRVALRRGDIISEADRPIASALFIESGVASIFKPAKPFSTEICIAGPESFCGTPLVLADDGWPYRTVVQSRHLVGVSIDASDFGQLSLAAADLHRALLKAVQVRFVQIAEGLVSNAEQRISQRLARWLLMYRDRLGSDRLEVTHEFMARMLGTHRTGVTGILHEMEGAGLISSRRGLVVIQDVVKLLALADGGYGVTERHQAKLLSI